MPALENGIAIVTRAGSASARAIVPCSVDMGLKVDVRRMAELALDPFRRLEAPLGRWKR